MFTCRHPVPGWDCGSWCLILTWSHQEAHIKKQNIKTCSSILSSGSTGSRTLYTVLWHMFVTMWSKLWILNVKSSFLNQCSRYRCPRWRSSCSRRWNGDNLLFHRPYCRQGTEMQLKPTGTSRPPSNPGKIHFHECLEAIFTHRKFL